MSDERELERQEEAWHAYLERLARQAKTDAEEAE